MFRIILGGLFGLVFLVVGAWLLASVLTYIVIPLLGYIGGIFMYVLSG